MTPGRRPGLRPRRASTATLFGAEQARCAALAYDYTVLAGTQGAHEPPQDRPPAGDRRAARSCRWCCSPRAAAGGRATPTASARRAWRRPASSRSRRLAGVVPQDRRGLRPLLRRQRLVRWAAAILIIATKDANIGMGGPAMIEGGGLGVFAPEEIGPMDVQTANGVVDILAEDEADAVAHRQAVPRPISRAPVADWTARRPAAAAPGDPGEPPAGLRHARR